MNYGEGNPQRTRPSALGAIFPWLLVIAACFFAYNSWFKTPPGKSASRRRAESARAAQRPRSRPPRESKEPVWCKTEVPDVESGAVAEPRAISPRGDLDGDELQTIDLFAKVLGFRRLHQGDASSHQSLTMSVTDIPGYRYRVHLGQRRTYRHQQSCH